jgi:hypothetical protein
VTWSVKKYGQPSGRDPPDDCIGFARKLYSLSTQGLLPASLAAVQFPFSGGHLTFEVFKCCPIHKMPRSSRSTQSP